MQRQREPFALHAAAAMKQPVGQRIGRRDVVRIERMLAPARQRSPIRRFGTRRIVNAPTKRYRCRNSSRNDSVGALLQQPAARGARKRVGVYQGRRTESW